ncbi:MAG: class III signal peptide-containing protein [archaeon]
MSNRAQGSLEYLLLIGGAILVGVVVFILATQVLGEGKGILETNLGLSVDITGTSADNIFVPLTALTVSTQGGSGEITLSYSAPGASSFLLVVEAVPDESDPEIVNTLVAPGDFDEDLFPAQKFALPFYEDSATYGAATIGWTYYFIVRACDDAGTCIISDIIPGSPSP